MPSTVSSPVTPFVGSATERALRGALKETGMRPDRALVVVCADDLERTLDQIEAYERGAPVGLLRVPTTAPWWVRPLTDVLVTGMLLGFAGWGLWIWGQR